MKNPLTVLIAFIIILVLALYMFMFQVRYDQVAVVTRFGKAEQGDREEGGSLVTKPGGYGRLPWPIQSVHKLPKTVQILEDQLEQLQTYDGYSVIMSRYVAWRIDDPLMFFVKHRTIESAQQKLKTLLREGQGVISSYRFDELVNADASKLKLEEIETRTAEQLTQRLKRQEYGIAIEQVGIRRVILPQPVTEKVFERMKSYRERLAQQTRSEGDAQAESITSQARSARDRILAFANRRAEAIKTEGKVEARSYYEVFKKNEDLAILMAELDALEEILANNTTFVFQSETVPPFHLFHDQPGQAPAGTPVAAGKRGDE